MKSLDNNTPKPRNRAATALTLVVYTALLVAAGAWLERTGKLPGGEQPVPGELPDGVEVAAGGSKAASTSNSAEGDQPTTVDRKARARLAQNAPMLSIELEGTALALLEKKRNKAFKRNWLVTDKDDYVQSVIKTGGEKTKAKIRLNGGKAEFWNTTKWSLRVKAEDNLPGFGFSDYTLRAPEAQGISRDWFMNRVLRREGFPTGQQMFVSVAINGVDKGIFLLAEILNERSLLDGPPLTGPILRFDDELGWAEAARRESMRTEQERAPNGSGELMSATIESSDKSRWVNNENNYVILRRALTLLDGFRRGEFSTSEVFNRIKLARFFALTDLFGATPAANWRNLRFHYDTVTARLEPLGFDAAGEGIQSTMALASGLSRAQESRLVPAFADDHIWFERLFDDHQFYLAYMTALNEVSKGEFIDGAIDELKSEIDMALATLDADYPGEQLPHQLIKENRKYIRSLLDPKQSVRAHLVQFDQYGASIAIGNLLNMQIEVLEVQIDDERTAKSTEGPVLLPARAPNRAVEFVSVRFNAPNIDWTDKQKEELEVRTRVLGVNDRNLDKVNSRAPFSFAAPVVRPPSANIENFDFLSADVESGTLTFDAAVCEIGRDLVIPAGWTVLAGPGTTIDLLAGSVLLTESPLRFVGKEDAPVRIISSDGTGQGVCVVDAEDSSKFEYVEVSGLKAVNREGWQITGGVTFYRSDFSIKRSSFKDMHCEDALNAIQCKFKLKRVLFENMDSDGFDADSAKGEIADCTFIRSADDAIDFSGSYVEIEDLVVDVAGDKGISAGEDCRVVAKDLKFEKCAVAMAAKNRSHITVKNADITKCEVGLAAYQNNEDSGPGSFIAEDLNFYNTIEKFSIKNGSSLELDGEQVKGPKIR